jgi:hypothetical protein
MLQNVSTSVDLVEEIYIDYILKLVIHSSTLDKVDWTLWELIEKILVLFKFSADTT